MKNASEYLGFYFVIFQRDLSGNYVKCWVDGDEDYDMCPISEFFEIVNQASSSNILLKIKNALTETGIFLWDVDSDKVTRLRGTSFEKSSIMDHLKKQVHLKNNNFENNNLQLITQDITHKLKSTGIFLKK